jgi:hypothetical protein
MEVMVLFVVVAGIFLVSLVVAGSFLLAGMAERRAAMARAMATSFELGPVMAAPAVPEGTVAVSFP